MCTKSRVSTKLQVNLKPSLDKGIKEPGVFASTGLERINSGYVTHHNVRSRCYAMFTCYKQHVATCKQSAFSDLQAFSLILKLYSGMSAAMDVYSHSEMTMKCSGHDVNISVTATTLPSTGPGCMGEAADMTFLGEVRQQLINKTASFG